MILSMMRLWYIYIFIIDWVFSRKSGKAIVISSGFKFDNKVDWFILRQARRLDSGQLWNFDWRWIFYELQNHIVRI